MWTAGKRQDDVSLTAHMISVFRSPHPYETDKAMWLASVVFIVIQLCPLAVAFFPGLTNQKAPAVDLGSLEYVSPAMNGVQEGACLDTANRIQLLPVKVAVPSTAIRNDEVEDLEDGKVGISFAHWPSAPSKQRFPLPLILVHGFDSSCLEYRRLGPLLAAEGIDVYAVDLLGWGFTQLDGVGTFSAEAKVDALNSFINEITTRGNGQFCIGGASLGGAAAIEVAATNPNCSGLILIDAQGFVDGIGPMATMPPQVAGLGVEVLKSVPLRSFANQMSFFDKATYATDEAVVIGRLHCLRPGWKEALVSFMQSGGFSPSTKLGQIECRSLVLWGRQDGILDGEEFTPKFLNALSDSELEWIEDCGHLPHLEKPQETADAIARFLKRRVTKAVAAGITGIASRWIGTAAVGATAVAMADRISWP